MSDDKGSDDTSTRILVIEALDMGGIMPAIKNGWRWDTLVMRDVKDFRNILKDYTHVQVIEGDGTKTIPLGTFPALEWLEREIVGWLKDQDAQAAALSKSMKEE